MDDPLLTPLAKRYNKTSAQILLRCKSIGWANPMLET